MNSRSWLPIGVLLAAVPGTAYCQDIVKMVDCKVRPCFSLSMSTGAHPVVPTGYPPPFEQRFALSPTDAAAAETEIQVEFLLRSPKTLKLLTATYTIVSPDGKPAFEVPLRIRGNQSATPRLELPKEMTRDASKYFVKGSTVVISFQTDKEIKPGSMEVLAGTANAKSHDRMVDCKIGSCVSISGGSISTPTDLCSTRIGPVPPRPGGRYGYGQCFAMTADATLAQAGIPVKFQLTSPKTMKLLSATYTIVSPDGKSVFEAPLKTRGNRSATPRLELPKEMTGEASKYFVKGSTVVVFFQTEKEIK